MKRRFATAALAAAACAAVALAVIDVPARAAADADTTEVGPEGVLSAEFDAFALRVEYDIPLPASAGTVPHVVGEVRRSGAGENAKGLSAAPTHFDAVVGGTYYDPDKSQKGDENMPPQVECFYPGQLVDTRFEFPTDTRAETAGAPATSYATAQCGAGPSVHLRTAAGAGDLPSVVLHGGEAEGQAQPAKNELTSQAHARATGLSFADGAITIGTVEASGASTVTGEAGGAKTDSRITVGDVDVAGVKFSIANDRLVVAGQEVAIDSAAGRTLVDAANTALKAAAPGCRIDIASQPDTFPQGYLLSRKAPAIGVAEDGTAAASMRSGLQVFCDIPSNISEPTGFNPQRLQAVIGFVYTGAFANSEPGGFSLGNLEDLTGTDAFSAPAPANGLSDSALSLNAAPAAATGASPAAAPAAAPEAQPAPADDTAAPTTKLVRRYRTMPVSAVRMTPTNRAVLFVVALAAWLVLTHLGLRRLRGVTQP